MGAGTKKIQQALASPGVLERFFDDETKINEIRGIFTGIFSLDHNDEGGGNNIYGDDIIPFLEKIKDSNERNAYILMAKITTPITKNYMVRPGYDKPQFVNVVSELCIFGYIIGDSK